MDINEIPLESRHEHVWNLYETLSWRYTATIYSVIISYFKHSLMDINEIPLKSRHEHVWNLYETLSWR